MRGIFTDGYNSFFHFIFGMLSYKYNSIIFIMILYQTFEYLYFSYLGFDDSDIIVDLFEFFTGYLAFFSFMRCKCMQCKCI